jgi:hypothetical protein
MRRLFIGALAATVVDCSCYVSPQASMEACTSAGGSGLACLDRSSVNQTIEPEPTSFNTSLSAPNPKPKIAARTEKPPSVRARHKADLGLNMAKSTTTTAKVESAAAPKVDPTATEVEPTAPKIELAATKAEPVVEKVEPPTTGRPTETADQVLAKAKATIVSRLDDPKSAEFGEMKRAMRTNTLGKSVDTICGRVKGKNASGEGTGDWRFLYLVKDDEAYVVNGLPTSIAATAYRNICNSPVIVV